MEKRSGERFISTGEMPWEDLGDGVSRKIMGWDNQVMMVSVKFEKGGVGAPHRHFHTQVTYIVNTSDRNDHVGGNEHFARNGRPLPIARAAQANVFIVAFSTILDRMSDRNVEQVVTRLLGRSTPTLAMRATAAASSSGITGAIRAEEVA